MSLYYMISFYFQFQRLSILGFLLLFTSGNLSILLGEQQMQWQDQIKLKVVQAGEPVLRQQARTLSREEILSSSFQDLIKTMKDTMRDAPGVGLAAPQVGLPIQLIVIEDPIDYHSHLTLEQLAERDRSEVPFHVIINPKIFIEKEELIEFFEGCLSVPELIGVVPRAAAVRVECLNEKAEPIVIQAKGWYARILQHEIDHLHGILYLDRVKTKTLTTAENFNEFWKAKSIAEIQMTLDKLADTK